MTARVALIGSPLRRSHSAVMHNAAFRHFGIDARYEIRPIETGQLPDFFTEVRGEDWLGFQVTTPHKQTSISYVDVIEDAAGVIGAINTGLRGEDGTLVGLNTDSPGFTRSLQQDLGIDLDGATVVVAGAGGAARAVIHACLGAGVTRVHVGNRTPDRARELQGHFADPRLEAGGLDEAFAHALSGADLAVNTTTVGMHQPGVPFDVGLLSDRAAVFDLVYVPEVTELLAAARERGLRAVNGLGMLVAQAAIAFERWTGVPGADAVMWEAIEEQMTDPEPAG